MKNKTKAFLLMTLSALFFSLMGAMVKSLEDIPVIEKVFFRNSVSLIIAFVTLKKQGSKVFGSLKNQHLLILRSLLGLSGVVFNFYAISHLYLADSSIIMRIPPFFVIIFAFLFLKEKINKYQFPSLILAILGAMLVIKPQFSLEFLPALSGFVGAIFAAAAYTTVRYLSKYESPATIVFYFSFVSVVVSFPLMMLNFKSFSLIEGALLLGTGLAAGIAQICLTYAYKLEKAGVVSIYNYSGILFSIMLGFIFWGEIPDLYSILGALLIVLSSMIIFFKK